MLTFTQTQTHKRACTTLDAGHQGRWPRRIALSISVLVAAMAAACGSSAPVDLYGGTTVLHIRGQISGVFNHSSDCLAGSTGPETTAVSFKEASGMIPGATQPIVLSMIVNVSPFGGSFTFPGTSDSTSVFLETASGTTQYQWGAGPAVVFGQSSGSMTIASQGSSGTMDVTLVPTSLHDNKANSKVVVDGSWARCPLKTP